MPSPDNRFVVACAGSRKTTTLVEQALAVKQERVLITTFTNENVEQITDCVVRLNGSIPPNVTIQSWYSFLLHEGARPYQNRVVNCGRIEGIEFTNLPFRWAAKKNPAIYYLRGANLYRDRVADFVYECNERSDGLVLARLEKIYPHLFIDELQDFAGYDWDILELLVNSPIHVFAVGDPRQATYATNRAGKNRKFKGAGMLEWIKEMAGAGLFTRQDWTDCHRCHQDICDLADSLYPEFPKSTSRQAMKTGHDGIVRIPRDKAVDYYRQYQPIVLRWNKTVDTLGLPASNIGIMKGRTFPRVMIFTTNKMRQFLKTKNPKDAGSRPGFYVALTRAMHSVALVD